MYKLRGTVGKDAQNHKGDVAYVQWVLGQTRVRGKHIYSGKINGRYTHDLTTAILVIRQSETALKARAVPLTQEKIYPVDSHRLNTLLPPQLRRYTPVPVILSSIRPIILLASESFSPPFHVADASLPDGDAKELLKVLERISFKFGVVTEIASVDLNSSQGYFLIRLTIKGAKRVDLATGAVKEGKGADLTKIEHWLGGGRTSRVALGGARLKPVFGQGLCLKTQVYPVLKISLTRTDVDATRWNTRFARMTIAGADESYIRKLYEYYEEYRLQSKMTPEIRAFFIQCFGKAAVPIKTQEEFRKARCRIFRDTLDSLEREKASLAKSLIEISNQYDESVQGGIVRYLSKTYGKALWNLAEIAAGEVLGRGALKASKAFRRKPANETLQQSYRREGTDEIITGVAGVIPEVVDLDISWVDLVSTGLHVVGIALFFVSPVGWLVGGLALVARFAIALSTVVEISGGLWGLWQAYKNDPGYKESQDHLWEALMEAQNRMSEVMSNIDILTKAAAKDTLFDTITDFELTPDELSAGKAELAKVGLAA